MKVRIIKKVVSFAKGHGCRLEEVKEYIEQKRLNDKMRDSLVKCLEDGQR